MIGDGTYMTTIHYVSTISSMARHPQEYVILGFLMKGHKHGYEIHRDFSSRLSPVWFAGMSHIYALLKRLEETGQVTSNVEIQENRPPRRVYSITPKGREKFLEWLYGPIRQIRDLRLQFPAKLFLMEFLGLSDAAELIAEQVRVCQGQMGNNKKQYGLCGDDFGRLVYQFRVHQIEAILAWLEACKAYGRHGASDNQNPGTKTHETG